MKDEMREQLTRKDIWVRALYMVLFIFAYSIAEVILAFLVVFQFFTILITGTCNEPLLRLGNNLSLYVYEVLQFQTFNSEILPFPFAPWPDEEPGGERWVEGYDLETEEGGDAPESAENDVPDAKKTADTSATDPEPGSKD